MNREKARTNLAVNTHKLSTKSYHVTSILHDDWLKKGGALGARVSFSPKSDFTLTSEG